MEWAILAALLAQAVSLGLAWRLWRHDRTATEATDGRIGRLEWLAKATTARLRSNRQKRDQIERYLEDVSGRVDAQGADLRDRIDGLDGHFTDLNTRFEEHGPHVREHTCVLTLSSVENDGVEQHYRCEVDRACKTRLVLKVQGRLGHALA